MKLQKHLSRKVGDKEYSKYVAVFPLELIEKSYFKEGDELEAKAEKGKIIIKIKEIEKQISLHGRIISLKEKKREFSKDNKKQKSREYEQIQKSFRIYNKICWRKKFGCGSCS